MRDLTSDECLRLHRKLGAHMPHAFAIAAALAAAITGRTVNAAATLYRMAQEVPDSVMIANIGQYFVE